jgi:hypothetical protein
MAAINYFLSKKKKTWREGVRERKREREREGRVRERVLQ